MFQEVLPQISIRISELTEIRASILFYSMWSIRVNISLGTQVDVFHTGKYVVIHINLRVGIFSLT